MSDLFEQNKNEAYEEALRERNEAMARYSLLHQKWFSVSYYLAEAQEELQQAERKLARVVGLTPTSRELP